MNKEFLDALNELEREKNISKEDIIAAIEKAVKTTYERNYSKDQKVDVVVDRESGEVMVLLSKEVVEEVMDDATEVSLEEARSYDERYEIGDEIQYRIDPKDFGRIAAQTAKQVVVQSIREAERNNTYDQFIELKSRESERRQSLRIHRKRGMFFVQIRAGSRRGTASGSVYQGIRNGRTEEAEGNSDFHFPFPSGIGSEAVRAGNSGNCRRYGGD